ncbi:TPA: hypothetical protein KKX77_002675 [Legionella pneumophila]|nr:hypothetical protein [Legionella pneumophila]HCU5995156.1 hypothetical protein [Legionella pneumophila]
MHRLSGACLGKPSHGVSYQSFRLSTISVNNPVSNRWMAQAIPMPESFLTGLFIVSGIESIWPLAG